MSTTLSLRGIDDLASTTPEAFLNPTPSSTPLQPQSAWCWHSREKSLELPIVFSRDCVCCHDFHILLSWETVFMPAFPIDNAVASSIVIRTTADKKILLVVKTSCKLFANESMTSAGLSRSLIGVCNTTS